MKNQLEALNAKTHHQDIYNIASMDSIQKAMGIAGSYQKAIDAFFKEDTFRKAINAASSYQKTINLIASDDAIQRAINFAGSYQKTIDAFVNGDAFQRAMNSASAYQKTMNTLANSDAIQRAMSIASSYQRTIDAFANSETFHRIMRSAGLYQQSIAEIMNNSSFKNAISILTEPSNLSATLDLLAKTEKNAFVGELSELGFVKEEAEHQLQEIGNAHDSESFIKAFSNLSPTIKVVLLFFILQLLAVTQNVVANIATPHIEKLLSGSNSTEREKIKQLQSVRLDELDLSNLRFVTTEHLSLRENPSTKSAIKDELRLGQVVTMINKQRSWTEISYIHEDGEIMHGWVFSRYTAKFKK